MKVISNIDYPPKPAESMFEESIAQTCIIQSIPNHFPAHRSFDPLVVSWTSHGRVPRNVSPRSGYRSRQRDRRIRFQMDCHSLKWRRCGSPLWFSEICQVRRFREIKSRAAETGSTPPRCAADLQSLALIKCFRYETSDSALKAVFSYSRTSRQQV